MRMKLKLLAVVAVVSILLVVLALQSMDSGRVDDLQSRQLLSEQQLELVNSLERISLARGQQRVELARDEQGVWGVVSQNLFPAQPERVAALLHALRGARVLEAKTDNPDYHARLGLDPAEPGEHSLQVNLQAGDQSLAIVYGNQVGSGQLVRLQDENQVWLINRPFGMTLNDNEWLDLQVAQLPMEQLATARWEHADGDVLALEKSVEGDYNFRLTDLDAALQQGNERWINSMVLALVNLRAQAVSLRSELDLQEPMLRMQVQSWEGAELEASLYEVNGRYWLLVDAFEQPEGSDLTVNADQRWAFQLGIGQVESMNKRQSDIIRSTAGEAETE